MNMLSLFWVSQHNQTCFLHLENSPSSWQVGHWAPIYTSTWARFWIIAEKQVPPGAHSGKKGSKYIQFPKEGVAKVTHQPRPRTSSESVPSRGNRIVCSNSLGIDPDPGASQPVVSGLLGNSLINSFSAHTTFQLVATENSDRDK